MTSTLILETTSEVEGFQGLPSMLAYLATFVGASAVEAVPGSWSVALLITDDPTISRLHSQFFGDDNATDVITFPSDEDLSAESGHLGDIVISVDTADENARAAGHSAEREIAFLLLHGLLHLFGYRDGDDDARERMLSRQEELLQRFEMSYPDARL